MSSKPLSCVSKKSRLASILVCSTKSPSGRLSQVCAQKTVQNSTWKVASSPSGLRENRGLARGLWKLVSDRETSLLLVCPAVGARAGALIHESLAVLATDLRPCWLWHGLLRRHVVSRHGRSITRTSRPTVAWIVCGIVAGIRIIPLIVAGWTISLWHWIRSRHVSRHLLRHASRGRERDLCRASHVGSTLNLDDGFETILNGPPRSPGSHSGHTNTERKCLGGAAPKIVRPRNLDITREENVLLVLVFLKTLVVDCYPYHFLVVFEDACLHLHAQRLDILAGLNVDLPSHALAFHESWLIESYPYLSLRSS